MVFVPEVVALCAKLLNPDKLNSQQYQQQNASPAGEYFTILDSAPNFAVILEEIE